GVEMAARFEARRLSATAAGLHTRLRRDVLAQPLTGRDPDAVGVGGERDWLRAKGDAVGYAVLPRIHPFDRAIGPVRDPDRPARHRDGNRIAADRDRPLHDPGLRIDAAQRLDDSAHLRGPTAHDPETA